MPYYTYDVKDKLTLSCGYIVRANTLKKLKLYTRLHCKKCDTCNEKEILEVADVSEFGVDYRKCFELENPNCSKRGK